ncbi:prolyl hydroxylase family protein [Brevundimonas aveniformis]|uniref:prolyl hydroxylase family protein n=1 Tax=Brevundimonas aveniformis TaxID=370977 RepID=UPI00040BAC26|nr:2OG-Fe(II) oxygenase [Brevundimonas aveniformis]
MRSDDQLDRDHTPEVLIAEADAGDAEAAHHLALMSAAGLARPQDWSEAFRRLAQAAASGHVLADETRRILGPNPDLASWLHSPSPRILAQEPHVLAIDGFVSHEACDWLCARALPHLEKAPVYDPETGQPLIKWSRSNSATSFDLLDCDLVMMLVRERIARATGLPVVGLESVQILHYAVGEAFTPHYDWLDPEKAGHRPDLEERGQRVATFLTYLNDDYEGGETEMEAIGLKHRGRKGDAFFWANIKPNGRIDLATRHAGRPPTTGEKWVYSQWLRNRAPRGLMKS